MPALEQRVAKLEWFGTAVYEELDFRFRDRTVERMREVGRKLLELVVMGEAEPSAFDGPQRDAVTEVIRFSLDALRPEAVPMIARLSARPVDHFFRGVCRVLVDLDAHELAQLSGLIASAARPLPDLIRRWPDDHVLRTLFPAPAREIDLESAQHRDGDGHRALWLRWMPLRDGKGTTLPEHSPLVALLIAHRLGREPTGFTNRVHRLGMGVLDPLALDHRRMTMSIDVLLDLHFVLSEERIIVPTLEDRRP